MSEENLNAVVENSAPAAAAANDTNTQKVATEPPPAADPNAAPASGEPPKTETVAAEHPAEPDPRIRQDKAWERVVKQRAEYKAKAELYEEMLAQQRQQPEQSNEPQREQFQDDISYYRAVREYDKKTMYQEFQNEQAKTRFNNTLSDFNSKVSVARKELPDIDEVLSNASEPIFRKNPALFDVITSSKYSAQIAYELAKGDNEDIEAIAALPPILAAREIGKIEARIEARKAAPAVKPAASKAPAPIKPVGAQGGEEVEVDWSKKSDAEYFAHLRKKGQMPK